MTVIEKKEFADSNSNLSSWSYDHPAEADRLLVFVTAQDLDETHEIAGVTYNGVAMDLVRREESSISSSGGRIIGGVFKMDNPPAGAHTLEVQTPAGDIIQRKWHVYSLSGGGTISHGAVTNQLFENVPLQVSVASQEGDLVLDHLAWRNSVVTVASIGTGQTQELADGSPTRQNGTSKTGTATSTTMEHMGSEVSNTNVCLYFAVSIGDPGGWLAGWSHRFKVTAKASEVSEAVTDLVYALELAPTEFWDQVAAGGADVRVTQADGSTEVAREVAGFDSAAQKGALYFRATGLSTTVDTDFYVYVGNPSASAPAPDAGNGREAIWDDDYVGVWHLMVESDGTAGEFVDSTANRNHGQGSTHSSGLPTRITTGPFGLAQNFTAPAYVLVPEAATLRPAVDQLTIVTLARNTAGTNADGRLLTQAHGETADSYHLADNNPTAGSYRPRSRIQTAGGTVTANTQTNQSTAAWSQIVTRYNGTIVENIFNGTQTAQANQSGNIVYTAADPVGIGAHPLDTSGDRQYSGDMVEVRVSKVARSTNWLNTHRINQLTPGTFWITGVIELPPADQTIFDEAGHTVGQFPDGWTDRGFLTGGTVTVENITGFSGGRGLRMARTTNTHRSISWNLPGEVKDGRIRALCRPTVEKTSGSGGISGEVSAWVTMRGQADDTYYRLQIRNANLLELVLLNGDVLTLPIGTGSATFNYALNDLIWLELEINGSTLRGRAWKDGDAVPGWMVEETDANISAAGWAGVGRLHDGEVEWDQVLVTSFDSVIVDETTDESITLGDVAAEDILLDESASEAVHLSELIIQDVTVGEVASESASLADLADDNANLDEVISGSISLEAILTEDVIVGESTLVITIKFSGLV